MKHLKSYKLFEKKETMVDKKIQLLKDLAVELEDFGFDVDVINGTDLIKNPSNYSHHIQQYNRYFWLENKKSILVSIEDNENFTGTRITDLGVIKEFEETLRSYGMNPRGSSSGKHHITYRFDKHGKMTRTDLIY